MATAAQFPCRRRCPAQDAPVAKQDDYHDVPFLLSKRRAMGQKRSFLLLLFQQTLSIQMVNQAAGEDEKSAADLPGQRAAQPN